MSVGAGFTDITLVGGSGTGNWLDANQIAKGNAARQVALDVAPPILWANRTVSGGTPGELTVTATKNAVTVTSASGTDTSTVRVYGRTHFLPQEWQS